MSILKNMNKQKSPNFTPRKDFKPLGVVIHGTLGKYEGAVAWLCTPPEDRPDGTYSSAHFVIGKNFGQITQLVDVKNESWHAGRVSNPTWRARKYLPRKIGVPAMIPIPSSQYQNPNAHFIGIELEWFKGDKVTEWQYQAVVEIIKNYSLPKVVLSHSEITDYKADFGRDDAGMLPVQEILRRLA